MSNSFQPHGLHAECQPTLYFTVSWSLLRSMSIESVMSSSAVLFSSCLHSFPAPALFSNELALRIRWPKNWSFSFSSGFFHEYSRFISLRIDWFDLLSVQGTLKSLLQYHNLKASVLQFSVFFMVQLSHCTWLLKKMNSEFLSHTIFHRSWVRMYSSKRVLN